MPLDPARRPRLDDDTPIIIETTISGYVDRALEPVELRLSYAEAAIEKAENRQAEALRLLSDNLHEFKRDNAARLDAMSRENQARHEALTQELARIREQDAAERGNRTGEWSGGRKLAAVLAGLFAVLTPVATLIVMLAHHG